MTSPFGRTRFETTLQTLQASPLPTVLVLNPNAGQQHKLSKQLLVAGLDYQQVHPVLSVEALRYALGKYQPHTIIIDEAWWAYPTMFQKVKPDIALANGKAFVAMLATELQYFAQKANKAHTPPVVRLLFMGTPQNNTILETIDLSTSFPPSLATLTVLMKPYRRQELQEALAVLLRKTAAIQQERHQTQAV
jgi:hypothetical protein